MIWNRNTQVKRTRPKNGNYIYLSIFISIYLSVIYMYIYICKYIDNIDIYVSIYYIYICIISLTQQQQVIYNSRKPRDLFVKIRPMQPGSSGI